MAVHPWLVTAGIDKVEEVLHNGGTHGHSVAIVRKGRERLVARRWNGDADGSIGFPNSYGKPTWDFLSTEEGMVLETHYRAKELS